MTENMKIWLEQLYDNEIEDTKATIANEHLWELGHNGEEPNPHTENIEQLHEYLEVLEELKQKVEEE